MNTSSVCGSIRGLGAPFCLALSRYLERLLTAKKYTCQHFDCSTCRQKEITDVRLACDHDIYFWHARAGPRPGLGPVRRPAPRLGLASRLAPALIEPRQLARTGADRPSDMHIKLAPALIEPRTGTRLAANSGRYLASHRHGLNSDRPFRH